MLKLRNGSVTTHVLDLAGGKPVIGISIELWYLGVEAGDAFESTLIGIFNTNDDGRVDSPLLEGEHMRSGIYELIFAAGDFFRCSELADSIFDLIPIRFSIQDVNAHYHVPLLVAPGGYSTYRGS